MTIFVICPKCLKAYPVSQFTFLYCPDCRVYCRPRCERLNCVKPATRSVYALGYRANVCEEHYQEASLYDREHLAVE